MGGERNAFGLGGPLSRRQFVGGSGALLGAAAGLSGRGLANAAPQASGDDVVAFYLVSDTHFLADKNDPSRLEESSTEHTARLVETLNKLPGTEIPERSGGGAVRKPSCVIHGGDVIDTGDKSGKVQEVMQRTEMAAFEKTMGLTGSDGALGFPIYEVHGNHDGPGGKGHAIDRIIERNKTRPGVTHISSNGLHYSWDVGDVHFINLGIVVGSVPGIARRRRYAPRESLEFLVKDLEEKVGSSGRPVIITHHIDIPRYTVPVPTDAPFSDKEWDPADVGGFHAALKGYNVPGVFYGHTHGRSVWRWDGASAQPGREQLTDAELETGDRVVYDVFNCDNSATPHGGQQAFFYVELSSEGLTVREYSTKDAWKTGFWSPLVWRRAGVGAAAAS